MKETVKRFVEETKELKALCIKQIANEDVLMSMEPEAFTAMQKCFNLMDTATELLTKETDMMYEINKKLDMLLKRGEKES